MAYNRNLYSSDTDALDAGIIYDQNELMMQDEVNAAIKNGDLIVGQADNLASKMNQFSTGEFIVRTTGGDASLSDGDGHLVLIRGNMIHTGYIAKSVNMTVTPIPRDPSAGEFTAQIDDDLFLAEMQDTSGTMVFTYGSSGWNYDPANYGITTDGLALPGDVISVTYQKEVRGAITQSNPKSFYSTGWNLYDHDLLRAKVVRYSDTYGFGVSGTYTQLMFSETLDGEAETITVTNGRFTVPADGYVFVIGGNDTDTAIWMTWSDWQEGYVGDFKPFEESEISLEDIMTEYFPYGLMAVGSHRDEIDLSLGKVTNNVARIAYTAENLDDVIELGVEYDYDDSYIYYGLSTPVVNTIEIDNLYAACDHGIEYYTVTQVPIYSQTLYGVNLKNRLERDVVTISQQTLSASEQDQILSNINAVNKSGDRITGTVSLKHTEIEVGDVPGTQKSINLTGVDKNNTTLGWTTYGLEADGNVFSQIGAQRLINGSYVYNYLRLRIKSDGTRYISLSDPAAWRTGLGLGSMAIVNSPVPVANGGTGATEAGAALNNLGAFNIGSCGIALKAGDNVDTDLEIGKTYYSPQASVSQALAGTPPVTGSGFKIMHIRSYATANYAYQLAIPSGGNIYIRYRADSTKAWSEWRTFVTSADTIPIENGGTGQTAVTSVTTASSIATAASGYSITSASYYQWGKLAQLYIQIKKTTAVTTATDLTCATVVSGKRPAISAMAAGSSTGVVTNWIAVNAGGSITLNGTWNANAILTIRSTYLLP